MRKITTSTRISVILFVLAGLFSVLTSPALAIWKPWPFKEKETPPELIMPVTTMIPYLAGREINLFGLESKRMVRSDVVVSPDGQHYAYSDVLFMPNNRQTYAKIYRVPVPQIPMAPPPTLPSSEFHEASKLSPIASPSFYRNRYNPDMSLQSRELILSVGEDRPRDFEFRTLTIVDWSASGNRLMFKQKMGKLHTGLRTSDILVFDEGQGTVTIYPELSRILRYYWQQHSNLPDLDTISWDIYPLGWAPGSNNIVLFKAWAFDKQYHKFLGIWQYDIDAQQSKLISEHDMRVPVAQNGRVAVVKNPPQ